MEFRQERFSESSSSESDSDNEANWKKKSTRKVKISVDKRCDEETESKKKLKGHEMWTENLTEQTLTEGIGQCQLKKPSKNIFSRGSESYDFTIKSRDPRLEEEGEQNESAKPEEPIDLDYDYDGKSDDELEEFGVFKENRKIKIPEVKERLGKRKQSLGSFDLAKVANKIIFKLKEKKPELIQRCVQFLGPKKSLDLLSMTLSVEAEGGMKTVDGSRRRTPGGVYLQLLKSDPNIRKDVMDKIFQDEKRTQHEMKKAVRKMKRKQVAKKVQVTEVKNPLMITDSLLNGPSTPILTVPDISCNSSDIEEGEIME